METEATMAFEGPGHLLKTLFETMQAGAKSEDSLTKTTAFTSYAAVILGVSAIGYGIFQVVSMPFNWKSRQQQQADDTLFEAQETLTDALKAKAEALDARKEAQLAREAAFEEKVKAKEENEGAKKPLFQILRLRFSDGTSNLGSNQWAQALITTLSATASFAIAFAVLSSPATAAVALTSTATNIVLLAATLTGALIGAAAAEVTGNGFYTRNLQSSGSPENVVSK